MTQTHYHFVISVQVGRTSATTDGDIKAPSPMAAYRAVRDHMIELLQDKGVEVHRREDLVVLCWSLNPMDPGGDLR